MRRLLPYAFNLTLDPAASLQVERAYAGLSALRIPDHDLVTQYGPCVTLLVLADRIDAGTIAALLALRRPAMSAVPARLTEPCIIHGTPPTLSIRVTPTDALLALHNAIYGELPEADVHLHYRPAYWQPHLKLCAVRDDRATAAGLVAAVASTWRPLDGVLDRLEVIRYPPAQSIWQAPLHPGVR